MSSSRTANSKINLRSISGPVEMRLLNNQFETIAVGYGKLNKRVPAGIYRLDIIAGSVQESKYISLESGEVYEDLDIQVQFPAAAPIEGTSTSHESHGYPAGDLSRNPNKVYGSGGRLLLFFRNVGEQYDAPINLAPFSLYDSDMNPIGDLPNDAVVDPYNGWAALSADLTPGGYILRNKQDLRNSWSTQATAEELLDQSLWVSHGWTTILFIPNWGNRDAPLPARASVYMAHLDSGFYFDAATPVNLALELALDGLRQGRSVVSPDLIDLLLDEKFQNPMLGIVGAYALLLEPKPRWKTFDIVRRNLQRLVPDHPDVTALFVIGKEKRDNQARSRVKPVSWPPMLYYSYRGLILRDPTEPGLILNNSIADQAASRLIQEGPWTRWQSLESAGAQIDDELLQVIRDIRPMVGQPKTLTIPDGVLALPGYDPQVQEPVGSLNDPEVTQVAQYVQQVTLSSYSRGTTEESQELSLQELSKKVGLPVSSVQRAMRTIAEQDLDI